MLLTGAGTYMSAMGANHISRVVIHPLHIVWCDCSPPLSYPRGTAPVRPFGIGC